MQTKTWTTVLSYAERTAVPENRRSRSSDFVGATGCEENCDAHVYTLSTCPETCSFAQFVIVANVLLLMSDVETVPTCA